MCGRYSAFTEAEIIEMNAIIAEISKKFGKEAVKTGEIFPTNIAPVLVMDGDNLAPVPIRWGFPQWSGKGIIINARTETVLEKPTFRKSLLERRCIVPSTGYYEWKEVGRNKKEKYLLSMPDQKMLYMAGFFRDFKDESGKPYQAFTILTTAASPSVAEIHDRMPVILTLEECKEWVNNNGFMYEILERKGAELAWCAV